MGTKYLRSEQMMAGNKVDHRVDRGGQLPEMHTSLNM